MTPINKDIITNKNGYVDSGFLVSTSGIFSEIKSASYDLMGIFSGNTVLDVGCGIGVDTLMLASQVGRMGAVIGVDYDQDMVKEANQRAIEKSCDAWVKHLHADADDLPFNDNQFSSVRCERLFQHLSCPDKAFSEMLRVAQLNGKIVVVDTDWGTLSINSEEIEIERKLSNHAATKFCQNGFSGRRLHGLFQQHQLKNINVHIFPVATTSYEMARFGAQLQKLEESASKAGILNDEELQQWRDSNERLSNAGQFFASVNVVMLSGCKTNL